MTRIDKSKSQGTLVLDDTTNHQWSCFWLGGEDYPKNLGEFERRFRTEPGGQPVEAWTFNRPGCRRPGR